MKILMVASEVTPFSKTGGLADVLGALPAALAQLGHEVGVVTPRYKSVKRPRTRVRIRRQTLHVGPHRFEALLDELKIKGVRYFLVDCPELYARSSIYTWDVDEPVRFAALTQAAFGVARTIFRPQILHAHDWHTGLLPAFLKTDYASDPTLRTVRTVFTIHNLGYQGNFPPSVSREVGLDPSLYHLEGLEFWDQVSFMKAGITYSDVVTTVSPRHAKEIQTEELGFGMDAILRAKGNIVGILNGVDYSIWDPAIDKALPANYSADDLEGKQACKRALLQELHLPDQMDRPVIGIISRFAEQKGFDLLPPIAAWLMERRAMLTVLGSGDPDTEKFFQDLAAAHPDQVALGTGYNEPLAHRIEAGADMFLMPSRYEPCGLNQIYSLKYGTVPVVRATGGLDDTVDESTGFKFHEFSSDALAGALKDALEAFPHKDSWTHRMRVGMQKNFSWDASARKYEELYNSLFHSGPSAGT